MGLRPSIFLDVGSVWGVKPPKPFDVPVLSKNCTTPTVNGVVGTTTSIGADASCPTGTTTTIVPGFKETFLGDTWKPRLSVGVGVNWNSPFGPFRIDVAKALLKQPGDDTKLFTFNVGTQF
jgi:outer membrane protein insertion porin family